MARKTAGKPAKAPAKNKAVEQKPDLAEVRVQIDGIDRRIQELIAERAHWAHQVGKAKGKLAAAVDYYRPEREAQVLRKVVDRNDGPLQDEVVADVEEAKLRHDMLVEAMDSLNDREKQILTERRLIDDPKTLEELSQVYHVSRERVRQIEVRAFEKLQKAMQRIAVEKRLVPAL